MIGWSQESVSELQGRPSGDGSKPAWKEAHDLDLFTLEDHNQGLGHHEVLDNPLALPVFLWLGPKWLSLARRGRPEEDLQKVRKTLAAAHRTHAGVSLSHKDLAPCLVCFLLLVPRASAHLDLLPTGLWCQTG